MAEIEIGVMCRQALAKPLPDFISFQQQIRAWTIRRNALCTKINWQFTTKDARIRPCLENKSCTKRRVYVNYAYGNNTI